MGRERWPQRVSDKFRVGRYLINWSHATRPLRRDGYHHRNTLIPTRTRRRLVAYGRDSGGQRFSRLTTINRNNVRELRVAWTFHTGDAHQPSRGRSTAFEATPIYVEGTLYLGTPLV